MDKTKEVLTIITEYVSSYTKFKQGIEPNKYDETKAKLTELSTNNQELVQLVSQFKSEVEKLQPA